MKVMKMRLLGAPLLGVAVFLAMALQGRAELRMHRFYTDNMVLQRDKPVVIKGWADAGAAVRVAFSGQQKTATADTEGRWSVTLDPMPANSEPELLACRMTGGGQVVLRDIVVGDLFLHARQSSIDVTLGRDESGRKAARSYAATPMLRVMRIKTIPAKDPRDDLAAGASSGWGVVNQQSALGMSGSAFYLGRDLVKSREVPIGLVDVDMGPHFGVGWMSDAALDASITRFPAQGDMPWYRKHFPIRAEAWASGEMARKRDEYAESKKLARKPSLGLSPLAHPQCPSAGYNAVMHPLRGIAIRAVLLQLGNDYPWVTYAAIRAAGKVTDRIELDRAWAQGYFIYKHGSRMTPYTLPLVPGDWRKALGDAALPMAMMLPPGSDYYEYGFHNIQIRELLRRTQEQVAGLDLIMPGSANIPLSGQPADDRLLAERCAKWVRGAVYGEKGAATGPVFAGARTGPGEAVVTFKPGTARGLTAKGDALSLFEVAGPDRAFASCSATLEGETVKLQSDEVYYIEFVRYNWKRKPGHGLVNESGLPVLPFTSLPDWEYNWWPPNPPTELPVEYKTPASQWPKRDIAIINGEINDGNSGDSEPNPSLLGPTGIISDPFGPNLYVHRTEPGSPADGKIFAGDIIFGANGEVFVDDQYRQLADAITYTESKAGGGKLVLGVRRKGTLVDVELKLPILGSYSDTTPFFCPKSERIVEDAENWLVEKARPRSGLAGEVSGRHDTDLWFLMASGKPEHQGLVRRAIYASLKEPPSKPDPNKRATPWHIGYRAILLGEYYHATGDPNVLPYLESMAGWAAATQLRPQSEPGPQEPAYTEQQVGAWRTRYGPNRPLSTGGYGLMAAAGMPCVMGMVLAKEAGVEVDEVKLQRGLKHFYYRRAEYGDVIYWYHPLWRDRPKAVNPGAEAIGKLWSMNGKLGTAAALFSMVDRPTAVDVCSRICVYSYNNTRHGHGGMFYNNFWTPIGAHAAGEQGFKHFMKGQTWWRELYRRHDGSFNQVGRGRIGVGYALHYVAHKKRLRLLGAPKSAFGTNAPDYLEPALVAHRERDYALAERLIAKVLSEVVIPAEEMPVVQHMMDAVQTLNKSIAHDLRYTETLIDQGRYYHASLELPQLKGILDPEDARLKAIVAVLESPEGKARAERSMQEARAVSADRKRQLAEQQEAGSKARKGDWVCLMTEAGSDRHSPLGKVADDEATRWRMTVLETRANEPEGWTKRTFDDGEWDEATLPVSWRVGHYALLRGRLTLKDKDAFDALRIRGYFRSQKNIEVYLNGEMIAKIDKVSGSVEAPLTDYAMQLAEEGENVIAIVTRHCDRWGKVKGDYSRAFGFGFRLDAFKPEDE